MTIYHRPEDEASGTVLWDRKTDGGFPETKELKRRVRDIIEPERDLGHVDRHKGPEGGPSGKAAEASKDDCQDCK